MRQIKYATCHLCEASCGIEVELEDGRIQGIRGDAADPLGRGHICPKAVALRDVHEDPDRLRRPLKRVGTAWQEVSWEQALDEVAARLAAVGEEHGKSAVAMYLGNPTVHSYAAMLYLPILLRVLRTRNLYSSNSVDVLPRLLTSYLMYGSQVSLPVPDLDRTDFLLILGANPAVSNGSIMTAPGCKGRIQAIVRRGGQVVVVDPRRTETAALATRHHFIRPGTDALLLSAMLRTILGEGLAAPGRLASMVRGLDEVTRAVAPFAPERVASRVGMDAGDIVALARQLAGARSAACYGRMGTCTQRFGAVSTWLIDCLNIVTGNLDREGGAMFATPAADTAGLAALTGQTGHFARWRSRVSGLPEFGGELPAVALAEEIETPGPGQVRALVTHAGNPVLSVPSGARLDRALSGLDFMVSIDIYRNETTRHAHFILPPTFGLERDHYALVFHTMAVRNTARFCRAVVARAEGALDDWEILAGLATRVLARGDLRRRLLSRALRPILGLGPRAILGLALRLGPHQLSLDELQRSPHGVDLGPLEPRLPGLLRGERARGAGRAIDMAPAPMIEDMARLGAELEREAPAGSLTLISRRQLRSNNSWMHNVERLVRGKARCSLLMHPDDAQARGIASGERVQVISRVGAIEAPVEVSDEMMPGVVSLPHGWGHDRSGAGLRVAALHAGVSVNDVTDDASVDALSGCASLEIAVRVEKVAPPC